ncbi:MAG TPA: carboxypeptidase-like regulatory domain-containing protein [Terriglobales bacterium]|nr:carboxypeptidase-like regulatory domain-containing protein [Terriglobales bacterium]
MIDIKRSFLILMITIAALVCSSAAQSVSLGASPVSDKHDPGRNVTGQVLSKSDAPLSEAIVYLKNTKTLTIKSFITEKDGGYRFHGLTPNIDYEIYAEYQGQKSGAKTLSSFDNRSNVTLNIHIDVK